LENNLTYLEKIAKEIRDSLTHFMLNHSEIEARKPYDEIWCPGPEGDRNYCDLDGVGRKMQIYLSERYAQFQKMLQEVLRDQPEEVLAKLDKPGVVVTRTIEHKLTWADNTHQALNTALAALDEQMNLLREIYQSDHMRS